jgi:hypothetical protein
MESFRTRMNSVLKRRSSVTSQDKDKSGSERESSRPPSPSLSHRASSLRKVSGDKEPKRRKRLSFSMRARSDTADTQEHSQIAQQVVAAYGEDKPTVDAETLPLDSSIEYSKIGNSMFEMPAAEGSTKESTSTVPTAVDEVPVVKVEDAKDNEVTSDAQVEEEKYTPDVIHIAPEADDHRPYRVEEPAPSMPEPMPYQHPSQDAEIDQTKLNTRFVLCFTSSTMIINTGLQGLQRSYEHFRISLYGQRYRRRCSTIVSYFPLFCISSTKFCCQIPGTRYI